MRRLLTGAFTVIFNNGCDELARPESKTVEGFLSHRLLSLVGSSVSAVAASVLKADTPLYDSQAQPRFD